MIDQGLITSVVDQTQLFASWVREADPALPVPSCPDWTLADLVGHVGGTQHWVATLTEQRIVDAQTAFALTSDAAPAQPSCLGGLAAAEVPNGPRRRSRDASSGADVFDPSGGQRRHRLLEASALR